VIVRSRIARALVVVCLALTAGLALPTPAQAASRFVGVDAQEGRCRTHPTALACFYFNFFDQGYWGTAGPDGNLGDNRYFAGTGQGSGQIVRNNSRKLHCDFAVANICESFFSPNLTGNDDWMFWGQVGELFFTWNDNASVRIS
jgi:hypothetical protein